MKKIGKIVAQIPARAGSKRVKAKNLRYLNGKPLLAYSITSALNSKIFEDVYVNSDSKELLALGESLGAKSYKRNAELASDSATGDQFNYDFIKNITPDTLVMINPVCPLVTSKDIQNAVQKYAHSDCDTLITCETTQMQVFSQGKAININPNEQLKQTQLNPSVETLNWAVTVWDAKAYIENYETFGFGYIGKKRELFPISSLHSIKISNEDDFRFAEILLQNSELDIKKQEIKYWSTTD